jgi:hypothetical protein
MPNSHGMGPMSFPLLNPPCVVNAICYNPERTSTRSGIFRAHAAVAGGFSLLALWADFGNKN